MTVWGIMSRSVRRTTLRVLTDTKHGHGHINLNKKGENHEGRVCSTD